MFCSNCGSQVSGSVKFCASCGAAVAASSGESSSGSVSLGGSSGISSASLSGIRKVPSLLGSGGALLLVTFFMPWISVSCSGQELVRFSGADLASGPNFQGRHSGGDVLLYLVPLAAIAALACAIYLFSRGSSSPSVRGVAFILAAAAVIPMLLKWISIQTDLSKQSSQTGGLLTTGTLGGFWLAILSGVLIAVAGTVESVDSG